MKSIVFSLLFTLLFAACALAENYIIEYPGNTSDRVLAQAKRIVTTNGGTITRSWSTPMAFAATTTPQVIESIKAYGFGVIVEDDVVVTAPSYKRFTA